jgi:hypothetical protein
MDQYESDYSLQENDNIIELIPKLKLDIVKEIYESIGISYGKTDNQCNYVNYLINNPSMFGMFGGTGGIDSEFGGAGAGKLPIPPGFYSDQVLFEFITHAEGSVGLQWVSTYKGHDIVRSAACYGYDFPGGVHDPSFISKLGLTPSDGDSLGITNSGRKPIGAESYGGRVQWGWNTKPIPAGHPYWKKFIPYYRDQMIWAWHQPGIQAITNRGERLARMHTINWFGYHYLKGLTNNDVGWNHRLQIANKYAS